MIIWKSFKINNQLLQFIILPKLVLDSLVILQFALPRVGSLIIRHHTQFLKYLVMIHVVYFIYYF